MQDINSIFYIIVLIMSVVVHEVAHGYAALYFGDKTAEYAGRLTFNPIKHLDLFGSVILPFILITTGSSFLVGWAKPVPYNPQNLRDKKWGTVFVASAGILANIGIAVFFGLVIRISVITGIFSGAFISLASAVVVLNIVLALFNLMPIPPLDGSKIIFTLLPYRFSFIERFFEKYSLLLLLIFVFFGWGFVAGVIPSVYTFITGIPLQ